MGRGGSTWRGALNAAQFPEASPTLGTSWAVDFFLPCSLWLFSLPGAPFLSPSEDSGRLPKAVVANILFQMVSALQTRSDGANETSTPSSCASEGMDPLHQKPGTFGPLLTRKPKDP